MSINIKYQCLNVDLNVSVYSGVKYETNLRACGCLCLLYTYLLISY